MQRPSATRSRRARAQYRLQGGGMGVPLAVLSQQRLHVIKYSPKVPELPDGDICAQL